jgi:4'-phosphopantetheinyl transferase
MKVENILCTGVPSHLLREYRDHLEQEVHVWRLDLENLSPNTINFCYQLLSQDEKYRAERFYFKDDRDRFINTRAFLRYLLGSYTDFEPSMIEFSYNYYGKPSLSSKTKKSPIHFNLTHSKDIVLYAFSFNYLLGIDIEYIRHDIQWKEIADSLFSENENSIIENIDPKLQIEVFYQCWTRKEAFLKGLGLGLSIPLNQFEVSMRPDEVEVQLKINWNAQEGLDWKLWNLPSINSYSVALATRGTPHRVRSFNCFHS